MKRLAPTVQQRLDVGNQASAADTAYQISPENDQTSKYCKAIYITYCIVMSTGTSTILHALYSRIHLILHCFICQFT